MAVGKNIKRIRQEKGLTQKQLGDLCNPQIAESTIRRYELGKLNPKIETVLKIADALKVDIFDLMVVPFEDSDNSQEKALTIDLSDVEPKDISKYLFTMFPQLEKDYKKEQKHIKRAEEMLQIERLEALTTHYLNLNETGQAKALEQVEMLTKIPDYRRVIDLFSGINAALDQLGPSEDLVISLDDLEKKDEQ